MSELIFVRHGQASFGAASYDKLSELGIEQVRVLARHWQNTGELFDHIVCGDLQRQQETAQELLPVIKGEAVDVERNAAFNEYNGDPLIKIFLRDHASNVDFGEEVEWPIKDPRLFQKVFEAATAKWIRDELEPSDKDSGFERFSDFRARVHSALDELMAAHTGGRRVLVSTSGGVIAMALQRVLNFPDPQVIETNWMVHNSSVTRVRYGGSRVSMTQFNSLPHLEQEGMQHLITYR